MSKPSLRPGDRVIVLSPITRTSYIVTVGRHNNANPGCFPVEGGGSVSFRRFVREDTP